MRKVTVDEYHRMIDNGILTEDDPVELIEGWIRYKMPGDPLHASRNEVTRHALERILTGDWIVRARCAITLSDSEPEPDLVVVCGPPKRYYDHHPGPREIGIVIEVANTTLQLDRTEKERIYARAGLPHYWIVNLVDGQVECYSDPSGPGASPAYRQRTDYRPGDAIPLVLGGQTVGSVPARDILP
jgi:Uma2 family endonuclease